MRRLIDLTKKVELRPHHMIRITRGARLKTGKFGLNFWLILMGGFSFGNPDGTATTRSNFSLTRLRAVDLAYTSEVGGHRLNGPHGSAQPVDR